MNDKTDFMLVQEESSDIEADHSAGEHEALTLEGKPIGCLPPRSRAGARLGSAVYMQFLKTGRRALPPWSVAEIVDRLEKAGQ